MERKSRELKTPAFFVFIFVLFNRKFNILEKKNNHMRKFRRTKDLADIIKK